MEKNKKVIDIFRKGGMVLGILTFILIALRFLNIIDWAWIWVLSPFLVWAFFSWILEIAKVITGRKSIKEFCNELLIPAFILFISMIFAAYVVKPIFDLDLFLTSVVIFIVSFILVYLWYSKIKKEKIKKSKI